MKASLTNDGFVDIENITDPTGYVLLIWIECADKKHCSKKTFIWYNMLLFFNFKIIMKILGFDKNVL